LLTTLFNVLIPATPKCASNNKASNNSIAQHDNEGTKAIPDLSLTCPHDHKNIKSFNEIVDTECCTTGHDFFLRICDGGCGALIDPTTHGNIEGQIFWKPSMDSKIYTFKGNQTHGCKYAICLSCACNMI
jgi:hypothetical protein